MDDKKKNSPTRVSLILRIVVSVYLLYLAWELRGAPANYTGMQRWFFIGAMFVFTVVGVVLGGFSLRTYLRGEYDQPEDKNDSEN